MGFNNINKTIRNIQRKYNKKSVNKVSYII